MTATKMMPTILQTEARAIDDLLRSRGFARDWFRGGPPFEPPFSETERGLRCYVHRGGNAVVAATVRGTWHLRVGAALAPVRGFGLPHLVRALRKGGF